jgi:hypothetical protein
MVEKIEVSKEMDWDSEDAEKLGTLKAPVDYKIDVEYVQPSVEFTEPKPKKKARKVSKTVEIGRNKRGLF